VTPVTPAPFGSWPTPVTSALVVEESVRLGELHVDADAVVWDEGRPSEGGRTQLVRRAADGTCTDLLPDGMNARTAVHEYGGAAWWVRAGVVWFVNWADQRLYRLEPGGEPVPVTAEPTTPRSVRWADGDVAPDGASIVCVRETHDGPAATQVRNEIVRISATEVSEPEVLVSGPDFVAAPRLSPDGVRLAWVQWNHPSMPWDDTELIVRNLESGDEAVIAGGRGESVGEPRWHPDGTLWFVSDRTDWWNLYRWRPRSDIATGVRMDAEIGTPAWMFGSARYTFLDDGSTVFARTHNGSVGLAVRASDGAVRELDLPFTAVSALRSTGSAVAVVAGTPTSTTGVYLLDPATGATTTLREPRDLGIDPAYISVPEHVTYPTGPGPDGAAATAHAMFYPPAHPDHTGPEGQLPPVLVQIHGGPTGQAPSSLKMSYQYWTSRGFAVVDVNYRGSTGYGRAFREELKGTWGIADVEDCMAAVSWLAARGRVDGERLTISGGSAGGYTVLAVLARKETPFAAGADYFGVADLEALARETHKFESRYLDGLVGPYPERRDVYLERSPITHVADFTRPLIVLQGAEDKVVPPAQSEAIVEALRGRGVPVAYLLFEGEQHGFRRAENMRRSLDAELSFYGQVLGFELPTDEGIAPVEVENLPR
jgi:dipeptidyl aminopeptidase/acylaminoacyl peptidase